MSVSKRIAIVGSEEATAVEKAPDRASGLLDAAARVFARQGFHDTKVSDIVGEAAVAQGTFYLYFKNKQDIYFRLVSGCCQRILDDLAAASAVRDQVKTAHEAQENSLRLMIGLFRLLESEEAILRLILTDSSSIDPAIDKMLISLKDALVEHVELHLRLGIEGGYFRPLDTKIIAQSMVGMVYHMSFERFVRGRDLGVPLEKLAQEIVNFEYQGLLI
jgi:AcrR family transcriptional regulator